MTILLSDSISTTGTSILGSLNIIYASDADHTLSVAEYTYNFLNVTSSVFLTATRQLIAPVVPGQSFVVKNSTSGGQSITVIGSSGTGVTIPNGSTYTIVCDGTNYLQPSAAGTGNATSLQGYPISASAPTTGQVLTWNGSDWISEPTGSSNAISLQGYPISASAPTVNYVLTWNGSNWIPQAVSGGSGNATALQGYPISATAPTTNYVLTWNGSNWIPQAASGGSGNATALQGFPISATTPTTNYVLTWNGSDWVPAAGGNTNNVYVYQPDGIATGNTYTTWTTVMAARANTAGAATIIVDNEYYPGTPPVDVGTWYLNNNTKIIGKYGGSSAPNGLLLQSGAIFVNASEFENLSITSTGGYMQCGPTAPLSLNGTFHVINGSSSITASVSQTGVLFSGSTIVFASQLSQIYFVDSVAGTSIVVAGTYTGTTATATTANLFDGYLVNAGVAFTPALSINFRDCLLAGGGSSSQPLIQVAPTTDSIIAIYGNSGSSGYLAAGNTTGGGVFLLLNDNVAVPANSISTSGDLFIYLNSANATCSGTQISSFAPVFLTAPYGNQLTYQPNGYNTSSSFTSWTSMMAVRATINGPCTIVVDGTYYPGNPLVDVGNWQLNNNTTIIGKYNGPISPNGLALPSGAVLVNPSEFRNLSISTTGGYMQCGPIAPIALSGTFHVINGSSNITASTSQNGVLTTGSTVIFASQLSNIYYVDSVIGTAITIAGTYTGTTATATTANLFDGYFVNAGAAYIGDLAVNFRDCILTGGGSSSQPILTVAPLTASIITFFGNSSATGYIITGTTTQQLFVLLNDFSAIGSNCINIVGDLYIYMNSGTSTCSPNQISTYAPVFVNPPYASELIYQPDGILTSNTFTSWTALMAVRETIPGQCTIIIDGTFIPTTPLVDVGTWQLNNNTIIVGKYTGTYSPTGLGLPTGAILVNPSYFENLYVTTTGGFMQNGPTAPVALTGTFHVINGSGSITSSTSQVGILTSNSTVVFASQTTAIYVVETVTASTITIAGTYTGTTATATTGNLFDGYFINGGTAYVGDIGITFENCILGGGTSTAPLITVSPTTPSTLMFNGNSSATGYIAAGTTTGGLFLILNDFATIAANCIYISGYLYVYTNGLTTTCSIQQTCYASPFLAQGPYANQLIYQPLGTALGNTYTSWTTMMTARANIPGQCTIVIDNYYDAFPLVDVGTWQLNNNTPIVGRYGGPVSDGYLSLPAGAILMNPTSFTNLQLYGSGGSLQAGPASPITLSGTFHVTNGSTSITASTSQTGILFNGSTIIFASQLSQIYVVNSVIGTSLSVYQSFTGTTTTATTAKLYDGYFIGGLTATTPNLAINFHDCNLVGGTSTSTPLIVPPAVATGADTFITLDGNSAASGYIAAGTTNYIFLLANDYATISANSFSIVGSLWIYPGGGTSIVSATQTATGGPVFFTPNGYSGTWYSAPLGAINVKADVGDANWVTPSSALTVAATSVSVAGTNITLTSTQVQPALIYLTGTLTASISIAFGGTTGLWFVDCVAVTLSGHTLTFTNGAGTTAALSPSTSKNVYTILCATASSIGVG
jgi:hypothetical protein